MNTKDKILEAALPLFIDHGYHGCSIKLIVEKSGVSTGSVYHHFSNKEDIIKELYAITKEHMNSGILKSMNFSDSIRQILRQYWFNRIQYTISNPLKAKFIKTYFNMNLIHSERLNSINKMYDDLQVKIKDSMIQQEILEFDIVYFFYDMFNAADAVPLFFETENLEYNEVFVEKTFKKYWRSIVNLNI